MLLQWLKPTGMSKLPDPSDIHGKDIWVWLSPTQPHLNLLFAMTRLRGRSNQIDLNAAFGLKVIAKVLPEGNFTWGSAGYKGKCWLLLCAPGE
jgi:hypothetical protein